MTSRARPATSACAARGARLHRVRRQRLGRALRRGELERPRQAPEDSSSTSAGARCVSFSRLRARRCARRTSSESGRVRSSAVSRVTLPGRGPRAAGAARGRSPRRRAGRRARRAARAVAAPRRDRPPSRRAGIALVDVLASARSRICCSRPVMASGGSGSGGRACARSCRGSRLPCCRRRAAHQRASPAARSLSKTVTAAVERAPRTCSGLM